MNIQPELFYCPYCGEQDLHPGEGDAWHFRTCLRSFIVSFTAIGHPVPYEQTGTREQA